MVFSLAPALSAQTQDHEVLASVEDSTIAFVKAFCEERFDDCAAISTGELRQKFIQFKDLIQQDPATYSREIPSDWRLLGSENGAETGIYYSYAELYAMEMWILFKMDWTGSGESFVLTKFDSITKPDLPDVNIHLSEKRKQEIESVAYELKSAFQDFDSARILPDLEEDMADEWVEIFMDESGSNEDKQMLEGSWIEILNVRMDEEEKVSVVVEVTIEHKDGVKYSADWLFTLTSTGWKMYRFDNIEKIRDAYN
jgi:hypothetical protein